MSINFYSIEVLVLNTWHVRAGTKDLKTALHLKGEMQRYNQEVRIMTENKYNERVLFCKEVYMNIKEVKRLMSMRSMSAAQLGESMGVKGFSFTKYENGTQAPTLMVVCRIAKVFGVSVDSISDSKRNFAVNARMLAKGVNEILGTNYRDSVKFMKSPKAQTWIAAQKVIDSDSSLICCDSKLLVPFSTVTAIRGGVNFVRLDPQAHTSDYVGKVVEFTDGEDSVFRFVFDEYEDYLCLGSVFYEDHGF